MEDQQAQFQFLRSDEFPAPIGPAIWQTIRRPRRGRAVVAPEPEQQGPYEASYSIQIGYPERELVIP